MHQQVSTLVVYGLLHADFLSTPGLTGTAFVPTDKAFVSIGLSAENITDIPRLLVEQIMLYHVVPLLSLPVRAHYSRQGNQEYHILAQHLISEEPCLRHEWILTMLLAL